MHWHEVVAVAMVLLELVAAIWVADLAALVNLMVFLALPLRVHLKQILRKGAALQA